MTDEQKPDANIQVEGQTTIGGGVIAGATAGGDVVAGDKQTVQTGGGQFVGRDQVINTYNYQLDVDKLVAALRQSLPDDDPTPQRLRQTLEGFQHYHHRLYEWKELHNYINDVLFVLDQFLREVERLDASGQPGQPRDLLRRWRPVGQKVTLLLEWAAAVKYIETEPFAALADGSMRGPKWAVELQIARAQLDELLDQAELDITALYDAAYDFNDAADRHMFLADKQLRDTAAELYNLSRVVLGGEGGQELKEGKEGKELKEARK
jgi:hypothetical protein